MILPVQDTKGKLHGASPLCFNGVRSLLMNATTSAPTPWSPQPGDLVVVLCPDDYVASLRNKIKAGRVGVIEHFFDHDPSYAWVRFPAVGRKKELRHQFRVKGLARAPKQGG